jgi:hypothetical protein
MAGPGAPPVAELADLGVRRVSVGMGIDRAAYALVGRAARELLTTGSYHTLNGGLDYRELNAILAAGSPAMQAQQLGAFVLASTVLILVPGVDMALVTRQVVTHDAAPPSRPSLGCSPPA